MPEDQILRDELSGGVLTLTLARPQSFNAFTRRLALELQAQLRRADEDRGVRVVVLTGEGRAFCAGQDLQELLGDDAPAMERILDEHFNPVVELIRGCRCPVIAAVNGVAAGAGANIAAACDIVLAAESASFIQAFAKIGLIPDSGGTWTLPRIIGWQRASALMLTGDKLDAATAERWGLVYRVYPDAELAAEARGLAERLAGMPARAFDLTKRALRASEGATLTQQLATEGELQLEASATHDYGEGVRAFVEKRRPVFRGE